MPNGGDRTRRMAATKGVVAKATAQSTHSRRQVTFKRKAYKVHRLVCEAFHGPPPFPGAVVLHVNENSHDNCPGNLKWGTQTENLNAPGFLAYCRSRTGDNNPFRKGRANNR
jgi:hypothetical protein